MTHNGAYDTERGDTAWHRADQAASAHLTDPEHNVNSAARDALEAAIGRAFHIRVLKEIARLSECYPELPLVLTENKVSIPCSALSGFAMSIQTTKGRYRVELDEWSDEFARVDEAMELIEDALRGQIRIRIEMGIYGRYCFAEWRLPTGEWIALPHHDDSAGSTAAEPNIQRNIAAFYMGNAF